MGNECNRVWTNGSELKLIFSELLQILAHSAGLRAEREHGARILFTFSFRCPILARRLLVRASDGAHTASLRAVIHHGAGIALTLRLSPDGTLRRILVLANVSFTHLAAKGACLENEPWVLVALVSGGPPRAVVMGVLARVLAHST